MLAGCRHLVSIGNIRSSYENVCLNKGRKISFRTTMRHDDERHTQTAVREVPASQDIPCRAGQVNPDGFPARFRTFTNK